MRRRHVGKVGKCHRPERRHRGTERGREVGIRGRGRGRERERWASEGEREREEGE